MRSESILSPERVEKYERILHSPLARMPFQSFTHSSESVARAVIELNGAGSVQLLLRDWESLFELADMVALGDI